MYLNLIFADMKKLLIVAITIFAATLAGCSTDDDGGSSYNSLLGSWEYEISSSSSTETGTFTFGSDGRIKIDVNIVYNTEYENYDPEYDEDYWVIFYGDYYLQGDVIAVNIDSYMNNSSSGLKDYDEQHEDYYLYYYIVNLTSKQLDLYIWGDTDELDFEYATAAIEHTSSAEIAEETITLYKQ